MKIKYINRILIAFSLLLVFACDDNEEYTGDSVLTPSSPTLTVALDFSDSQTLVEADNSYNFTVTLSEPQIVNVSVNLSQTGGTATKGDDFDFPAHVVIPKGATSASGVITVIADELIEETETATIQIATGSESNVSSISGKTVNFSIMNVTEGDLALELDWAATGYKFPSGEAFSAYDLADLRLLISSTPDNAGDIISEDSQGHAEAGSLLSTVADGEYYVVADFTDAYDESFDVDLTLTLNQVGVINNQVHNFSAALNSELTCSDAYYVLAKITKTGDSYSLEEVGERSAMDISGTYDVVSNATSTDSGPVNNPLVNFASTVTITDNGDGTFLLSDGWAGVYIDFYSIYGNTDEEPQNLSLNLCSKEIGATWTDIFGGSQTLTGTVNPDGTIDVRIDNQWGDFSDAVYTPQ